MGKCIQNCVVNILIQLFIFRKPQFHFSWMDVDVQHFGIDLEMQYGKRIFMLHHKGLVSIFDGFGDNFALNIPSVYEIVFKVSVSSGDHRLSNKTSNFHAIFKGLLYFQQIIGNIPSVDIIDNIFQAVITGRM